MKKTKPQTRTEASAPAATRHLTGEKNQALDVQGEAEHIDGALREKLTLEMTRLGGKAKARR